MNGMTLKDKVVIITGASSGYGRGTAYAFAAEGAKLVLTARREDRLQEVVAKCEELGGQAVYYAGDAVDEATAEAVVKLANDTYGPVDVLVNNAGMGMVKPVTETTMADYDLMMNTNVRSAFAFTKAVVPQMLEKHDGHIILVSSVTGVHGAAGESVYTMTKFALRGLGQSLDKELLKKGVRSTVFCPHAGITEFEIGAGRTAGEWEKNPFLTPEDVGQALVTVCSQTGNAHIQELRFASNMNTFGR